MLYKLECCEFNSSLLDYAHMPIIYDFIYLLEVKPVDVPAEFLHKRVIPVHLEIEDLPIEVIEPVTTETPTKSTVEVQRVRRTVTVTEVQIEEIPTEEMMEFVIDETSPIPSEIVVDTPLETLRKTLPTKPVTVPRKPEAPEDLEIVFETMQETQIPLETLPEVLPTKTVTVPKATKPTSPSEAPEDLEIVFETMQETQKPVTELMKPEEYVTEEIEALPTKATTTAQLALYESPKPTVTMTFKLPEELNRGTHLFPRKRMIYMCFLNASYLALHIAYGMASFE